MHAAFTLCTWLALLVTAVNAGAQTMPVGGARPAPNPAIDSRTHLHHAAAASRLREVQRLSEADFIRASRAPNTVVLDARSRDRYQELHIAGAVNLSFPDITAESLARLLPDRNTRILIYCNNNFVNAPNEFARKLPAAALNLSTFTTLYTYGYRNVFELAPLVDVRTTKLALAGTSILARGH